MNEAIILVAHGTRDPEGISEFLDFVREAQTVLTGRKVKPCFLEFAEPSVLDAIEHCVADGAKRVIIIPLFLVPAGHLKNDVPSAIQWARSYYPAIEFRYGAHLGVDARLLSILDERIAEVELRHPHLERAKTAILIVGRGSSDPDGNSDVFKIARLFWEGRGFGWVETCFCGITRPLVPEGIKRCVSLGAKHIIVLPYFLFTGILIKRIAKQAQAQQARFPDTEIINACYLGNHPNVVQVMLERIDQAVNGKIAMSCDLCKYRHKMPGFEHQQGVPQVSDDHHGLRAGHDHHHHHEQ